MDTPVDPDRWSLARELFDGAVARPPGERDAFLRERCGEDDDLLREVRSLMQAHEATSPGLLDRLADRMPRLGDALAEAPLPERVGPYRISGEVGRGGMGVVYRARDPRLRRDVALKFLPEHLVPDPEARARFVEEARAASALDHPHICTIHDIGSTEDGRLYIAMAWYGGGTLADRLRDGPLSATDAARIAREVADALHRAHGAGIVHRDVKPANIAFAEGGQAKVLDFGVAALESDASAARAGTPRYMAPEQLRGEPSDRRADIWSLGAVLHEMLRGAPPYDGEDRPAVLRSIEERGTPSLAEAHPALAAVASRALAPDPDDRFGTAAEMSDALRDAVSDGASAGARLPGRRAGFLVAGAAAVALAVSVLPLVRDRRAGDTPVDPDAVAVLPFRVSGEPSLDYLREGMVDLLSAKLPGEGGLRASDPRTVSGAWLRIAGSDEVDLAGDSALAVARAVGAARVLLGDVVGTPTGMIVNATLVDRRGRVVGRASVDGRHEELADLVDRLAAELLSTNAGEEATRVSSLTSTSLPALRAFLEGRAAYRRGRYEDALARYGRALELDSTFALAGLGVELAGGWVGGVEPARDLGRDVAWRHRERLSPADRALLVAAVGPDYPGRSSVRRKLDAIEDGLRLAPDRVELWYLQADALFHHGRALGMADWEAESEGGFRRAVELDSSFAAPAHHLILLHARRDDLAALAAATTLRLAREPGGSTAAFIRWLAAVTGASRARDAPPLESMTVEALGWLAMIAQDEGLGLEDGRRAVELRLERPGTAAERFERLLAARAWALNAGRPEEALAFTERLAEGQPDPGYVLRLRVLDALYADGDTTAAARAADALAAAATGGDPTARLNGCVADQWRLVTGRPGRSGQAPAAVTVANGGPGGEPEAALGMCEAVLAALREAARRDGSAGRAAARLDSLLAEGPFERAVGEGHLEYAARALAGVYERAGEPALALGALGRRVYFLGWQANLAATLRDEARLAAALGDTASAIRASEHYLALRAAPEPAFGPEVVRVASELARLRAPARR